MHGLVKFHPKVIELTVDYTPLTELVVGLDYERLTILFLLVPFWAATIVVLISLLVSCVIWVLSHNQRFGLLLWKGGHVFFCVCFFVFFYNSNDFSACCANEGETGTLTTLQMNWTSPHPTSTSSRTLATGLRSSMLANAPRSSSELIIDYRG